VDGFETILDDRRQSANLTSEHDQVWLNVDQKRISQGLSNLLSNASKYSPEGSSITVTSQLEGDGCVISVTDEGNGMTQED
jgi:signal transduction histidine kinase